MTNKSVFIFVLLVIVSSYATFDALKARIAQHKNAGLYVTVGQSIEVENSLTFNLNADGGCGGTFIALALSPVVSTFDLDIGDVECSWKVTGFTENNDPITELLFLEYVIDPDSVLAPNGTCANGCIIFGIETGIFKDDKYIYNESTTFVDLAFNPVSIPAFGGDILTLNNTAMRFTPEDAVSILESRGGQRPPVPDVC